MREPTGQSELTPRQAQILLAVVAEYTGTATAVPSKTVQEKYAVTASRATIRNEMAELERLGYLRKPHTSGGRIPQQAAYRLYVDHLGEVRDDLSRAHAWVCGELGRCQADVRDLLRTSARVLTELTGQPALVSEPGETGPIFEGFRLAPISARAVRVTFAHPEQGRREVLWEPPRPLRGDQIQALGEALASALAEGGLAAVSAEQLAAELALEPETVRSLLALLVETGEERVYVEGASRLLGLPEFTAPERLRALLAALAEERVPRALLRPAQRTERITVLIGSELERQAFVECSLVAQSYRGQQARHGALGVLGPLRMPYWRAMCAVHCVAREVSGHLGAEAPADQ